MIAAFAVLVIVIVIAAVLWPGPDTRTPAERAILRGGDLTGTWIEVNPPREEPSTLPSPVPTGISSYSFIELENLTSETAVKTLHVQVLLIVFNTTNEAVNQYWSGWHTSGMNLPVIGNLSQMYNRSASGHPAYSLVFQQGKALCYVNGYFGVYQGSDFAWVYQETGNVGLLQYQKISHELI